ncbi:MULTISPECIES: dihydroxyacetone kinase family protein [Trueperella]|uniref:Dihydroxyacetone kinase family protein n=1 Tax=Trueperella bernardiae TaxID=59561 RepID=A0A0W1KJT1_9ACTO|nr:MULTISPECIES: dihydroxyacetone kinase family protein [Trueperella]KTF04210.1 PTS-dependent dihydroxyacetone kinase, dihydroxyacetone-binding subunit DhaK [Trueperella bernardiae]MDK8601667.1 dihydroxyacetone kinase family protein [Trueperella bernardiae]OFS67722.1 D-erythrulose kinase [Trueperella sp. HMSC08H06]
MTFLVNDPEKFPAEAVAGFAAAYSTYVQPVHGGVVRTGASPKGEVSIVVGGGSGHYPAFAGWVGQGMAHGAVCGNIFSSPSASQATSVCRAADNGGGTIIMFGNYAGDVLHFGNAAEQLRAEGQDVRIFTISDDIASNTPENHLDRRGIAGDLLVVKAAGAAAAEGMSIDDVEAVAVRANARTRTLGVAFTGCTFPGATEPLFEVAPGTFGLGLGIHGEPGISEHEMMSCDDIAAMIIDKLLEEEPARGEAGYEGRVAVLVNGLGATKYEEMFVFYGAVKRMLEDRGLTIVGPVVDEQVTSLDMAGISLSLMFLDDELERLWLAPADTPAYRVGSVDAGSAERRVVADEEQAEIEAGAPESAEQAKVIARVLAAFEERAREVEHELGHMDSVAGDGDHGQGMVLGATAAAKAAREAVEAGAGARTLLARAGAAWSEGAGGTAGALWGGALAKVGAGLSDDAATDDAGVKAAVVDGVRSFVTMGGAAVGDKTIVDASEPFADALAGTDAELVDAWADAADAAEEAAAGTANFAAKKGRARTHGDKSVGTPDPGATSFAILMKVVPHVIK